MASLLSTQELSKQYGKQKAVHQVSLTINKGEICGLVGEMVLGKQRFSECYRASFPKLQVPLLAQKLSYGSFNRIPCSTTQFICYR